MTTPSFVRPTCTVIVSASGEPIVHCGEPARSAIYTTSPVTHEETREYVCGPEHLARELHLIALYEVCDFRVDRFATEVLGRPAPVRYTLVTARRPGGPGISKHDHLSLGNTSAALTLCGLQVRSPINHVGDTLKLADCQNCQRAVKAAQA